MTGAIDHVAQAFRDGIRPERRLRVSEWADRHRTLDSKASARPGRWRTSRTPYLREPMDALSPQSGTTETVLQFAAQLGKTESGNNLLGYVVDHAPGPMMMVLPTVETAKRSSKQRVAPMIEASPRLRSKIRDSRSRDSGNTILMKDFPGGTLIMTGANSATGLRSMPARVVFGDEIDAWPDDVDGEGDPIDLCKARTSTYGRKRRHLWVSTPTIRGFSKIERMYERGTQELYFVPCPHCGAFAPICWQWPSPHGDIEPATWHRIRFDDRDPLTARLGCGACEEDIQERAKPEMLARGEWRATNSSPEPAVRSFHLSSLYSPLGWYSWQDCVREFLDAKDRGRDVLKTWTNTRLGETFEEYTDQVRDSALAGLVQEYEAEVPREAVVLTAGVDMQDDRAEVYWYGWAAGEKAYAIDSAVVWGDPGTVAFRQSVEDTLAREFKHETGAKMRAAAACIDSGGHYTEQVYEIALRNRARRWYAIKGVGGYGIPLVAAPQRKKKGRKQMPVELFRVAVDEAKSIVYSRLQQTLEGTPFYHFPATDAFDDEFFRQLTAERIRTKYVRGYPKRVWELTYSRNEALDCAVYALAALYILAPNYAALAKRLDVEHDEEADAAAQRTPAVRRRKSWVRNW